MELQDRIDKIMSQLPIKTSSIDYQHPYIYVQHISEIVEKAQSEILNLCSEILKVDTSKWTDSNGNIYRQGIIGRYIDDYGDSELYNAWSRFMCIDNEYREFDQQFYVEHYKENQNDYKCMNDVIPELIEYFRDSKINQILDERINN